MISKGVTAEVNTAIERAVGPLVPPWAAVGPVLSLTFTTTGERLVPHRLGARPGGLIVLAQTEPVCVSRVGDWTDAVAYLSAPAGTFALVVFLSLRAEPEVV